MRRLALEVITHLVKFVILFLGVDERSSDSNIGRDYFFLSFIWFRFTHVRAVEISAGDLEFLLISMAPLIAAMSC